MSQDFGVAETKIPAATFALNGGPVGSIYQPTRYFPKDERAGIIAGGNGPVPGPSNFQGQERPRTLWNTVANFGNPLAFLKFNRPPSQE